MPSKKVLSRTERSFQKWFVEQMVGDGYDPFREAHWFWGLQTKYLHQPFPSAKICKAEDWTWLNKMRNLCFQKKVLLMEHIGEDNNESP
jgi:hypothetical protein